MFFIVVRKTEINQEWHLNGVDTVIENEIIEYVWDDIIQETRRIKPITIELRVLIQERSTIIFL